jgi:hypothetical protein
MEQGLTGVESRRCSAPSRGKAAARVVRRCGVRWGRRGVRLGLRRAGPRISACAPAGKVAEVSGGRCGSAGKTELAAGPGPSAGLGSGDTGGGTGGSGRTTRGAGDAGLLRDVDRRGRPGRWVLGWIRGKGSGPGRSGFGPDEGEVGLGRTGERGGLRVGFCFSFSISPSLLFLVQTSLNSNKNLNSNHTQTIKTMHQHECNTKIKPRQILITCETKLN